MERRHILRLRDAEPVKNYIFSAMPTATSPLPTMSPRASTPSDASGERPTPSNASGERPTPSNASGERPAGSALIRGGFRAHPAGHSPRTPANHPKPPKPQKKAEQTTQKMICPAFLLFIFPQKISQSPFAPTSPAHTPHSHSHTSHPASSGSYTSLHSPDPDNKTYYTT